MAGTPWKNQSFRNRAMTSTTSPCHTTIMTLVTSVHPLGYLPHALDGSGRDSSLQLALANVPGLDVTASPFRKALSRSYD